jgi:hypothetical protein
VNHKAFFVQTEVIAKNGNTICIQPSTFHVRYETKNELAHYTSMRIAEIHTELSLRIQNEGVNEFVLKIITLHEL